MATNSPTTTIPVSLGGIVLVILCIIVIGFGGGYAAYRFFSTPITVLPNGEKTIVPVSQQVTISPSKSAEAVVSSQEKSVLLLIHTTPKGSTPAGTGVVLTNDGVIAALGKEKEQELSALGGDGIAAPLTPLGTDALSGVSFFKVPEKILPPVSIAQQPLSVGGQAIGISRSEHTLTPIASHLTLSSIIPPAGDSAPGIQRVGLLAKHTPPLPVGTALFNDDGRLIGIVRSGEDATVLLTPDITAALGRLSDNALGSDPFSQTGISLEWKLEKDRTGTLAMRASVTSIAQSSPAAVAGVKVGDILMSINGNALTWDSSLAEALMQHPLTISLLRKDEERTVSIP